VAGRWALSGIGFVACFVLAIALYGNGAGDTPREIAAYYASQENRLRAIGGFGALLAGLVLFLIYVATLRAAAQAEPFATLVLVGGVAGAVLLMAANALWAGTAFAAELEPSVPVGPSAHLIMEDAGYALFVSAMAADILLVAAASLAALRNGSLPRWLAWLGFAVAASLVAAYWYVPLFLFLVWVLAVSVVLARRGA